VALEDFTETTRTDLAVALSGSSSSAPPVGNGGHDVRRESTFYSALAGGSGSLAKGDLRRRIRTPGDR